MAQTNDQQRVFTGKMDLDSDDRLVKPGDRRYSKNVQSSRVENADAGALENIRGNAQIPGFFSGDPDYITIGTCVDETKDKIYWFFVGRSTEGIYEFDIQRDSDRYVPGGQNENQSFGDPRNQMNRILEFSRKKKIFNFSVDHLITGANVIDNLLFFTDGLNPPRKVNLDRFRGSGNYYFPKEPENWSDLRENDDDAWDEENARESNLVFSNSDYTNNPLTNIKTDASDAEDGGNARLLSDIDPEYDAYGDPISNFGTVPRVNNDSLDRLVSHRMAFPGDIISVIKRPPLFPPIISVMDDQPDPGETQSELEKYGFETAKPEPGEFLFDNFVFFAYRYKYKDGEVSALSPFSKAAFLPRQYKLVRDPASFASMVNTMGKLNIRVDVGSEEVTEVEIVLASSANTNIYSIAQINKKDEGIASSGAYGRNFYTYNLIDDKFYISLPSDQITRIYDNVPVKAKAQEIIGNRLVYGNYTLNYDIKQKNADGADINVDIELSHRTVPRDQDTDSEGVRSVKSDRTYEIGIVYLDAEGRQTPALISERNTYSIPFKDSINRNILKVDIHSPAPYWATHYRFFIKETKGPYYNVFPKGVARDTFDSNEGRRLYLRLDASEVNKIGSDTKLILKRANGQIARDRKVYKVDILPTAISDGTGGNIYVENGEIRVDSDGVLSFATDYDTAQTNTNNAFPGTADEPDTEANSDYYIAISPVDESDLNDFKPSGEVDVDVIFETVPALDSVLDLYYEHGETFRVINGAHTDIREEFSGVPRLQSIDNDGGTTDSISVELNDYFNTFSYTSGLEESRILGEFNGAVLPKGVKASTINEEYQQRVEETKLIHSGIYNGNNNINNLNEFNPGNPITTELDVSEGSIQKLHSRDTNLVVFQEDKVSVVPIQKNLIRTGDGRNLLTSDSRFFGVANPLSGEYGISQNPESFCEYGHEFYWADRNRGVLLQFDGQRINEISKYGVEFYVRDKMKESDVILGFYDDYTDQAFFSFRESFENPFDSPNLRSLQISVDGDEDPRTECNRDVDFINFKTYSIYMEEPARGITLGDAVFSDSGFDDLNDFLRTYDPQVPFNGNNRWYRVKDSEGTNSIIQISHYGIVIGVENDCSGDFPPDTARDIFNISSHVFDSKRDACASGLVDTFAYHDGVATEPDPGDTLFANKQDLTKGNFNGYYLITEGVEKWVINVVNGQVTTKTDCDQIARDRTPLLGSFPIGVNGNIEAAIRNLTICSQSWAEALWWFRGENSYPEVGGYLYANEHNDDGPFPDWSNTKEYEVGDTVKHGETDNNPNYWRCQVENGAAGDSEHAQEPASDSIYWTQLTGNFYVQLQDGVYLRFAGDGEILELSFCSERQCFLNPEDIVEQSGVNNNMVRYENNLPDVQGDIQHVELEFYIESPNLRIPATGGFKVNVVDPLDPTKLVYDKRLDDTNIKTPLSRDVVTPITFDDDEDKKKTYTISLDGADMQELFAPYKADYELEASLNPSDIKFRILTLCYRGLNYGFQVTETTPPDPNVPVIAAPTPLSRAWISERPIDADWVSTIAYDAGDTVKHNNTFWKAVVDNTNVTPVEGATWTELTGGETPESSACGDTVSTDVYFYSDASPRVYYINTDKDTFNLGAGKYGVSYVNPTESEGGGVVQAIHQISASGTLVAEDSDPCGPGDEFYTLDLGFTPLNNDNSRQDACRVATSDFVVGSTYGDAQKVSVKGNEPYENFSGDDANPLQIMWRVNPNINIIPPLDGWYSNGTVIRPVTAGVVGANDDTGCDTSLTYVIEASHTVPNVDGESPVEIVYSSNAPSGMEVVSRDQPYSLSATIQLKDGYQWASGSPNYSVDSAAEVSGATFTFSGTADATDTDDERDRSVVFSGTAVETEEPTYNARVNVNFTKQLDGSTISFENPSENGTQVSNGNSSSYTVEGLPLADNFTVTVKLTAADGEKFDLDAFSPTNAAINSDQNEATFVVALNQNNTQYTLNFDGVYEEQPPDTTNHTLTVQTTVPTGITLDWTAVIDGESYDENDSEITVTNNGLTASIPVVSNQNASLTATVVTADGYGIYTGRNNLTHTETLNMPTADKSVSHSFDVGVGRLWFFGYRNDDADTVCQTTRNFTSIYSNTNVLAQGNVLYERTSDTTPWNDTFYVKSLADQNTYYFYNGSAVGAPQKCDQRKQYTGYVTRYHETNAQAACSQTASYTPTIQNTSRSVYWDSSNLNDTSVNFSDKYGKFLSPKGYYSVGQESRYWNGNNWNGPVASCRTWEWTYFGNSKVLTPPKLIKTAPGQSPNSTRMTGFFEVFGYPVTVSFNLGSWQGFNSSSSEDEFITGDLTFSKDGSEVLDLNLEWRNDGRDGYGGRNWGWGGRYVAAGEVEDSTSGTLQPGRYSFVLEVGGDYTAIPVWQINPGVSKINP